MARTLEYFFDFNSSYSYLASTQIDGLAERTGAQLRWRPFLLGAVFKATGNLGPLSQPSRLQYLIKDCGDWSRAYKVPFVFPSPFPVRSVEALRLALVADEQGKLAPFAHRVFHALWGEGAEPTAEMLAAAVVASGMDPKAAFERAQTDDIKSRLRANTDEALARGVFGAPAFFVDRDDMYFGNDRLMFVERTLRTADGAIV